jgi:hypothetical protein
MSKMCICGKVYITHKEIMRLGGSSSNPLCLSKPVSLLNEGLTCECPILCIYSGASSPIKELLLYGYLGVVILLGGDQSEEG